MDFDAVYKEMFKPVYAYVLLRTQDENLAQDLASKTWQKVFDRQDSYDPRKGNFRQWLFTIARNEVNSYFRLYYVRKVLSISAFEEDFKNSEDNPETAAEQKDLEEKLKLAMGKLKSNYRDILALKFYSGMSNEEIAQMLNISASNVGTIINRAVNKLRILLEAEHVA